MRIASSGVEDAMTQPNKKRAGPRRPDDGEAFLPDPTTTGKARTEDDLPETLAEEFVQSATSAEEVAEDIRDGFYAEEVGGPFIQQQLPPEAMGPKKPRDHKR